MDDRIRELEGQMAALKNEALSNRRKLRELENAQITLDNRMLAIDKELRSVKAGAAKGAVFGSRPASAPQSAPQIRMTPVQEPSVIMEPIDAQNPQVAPVPQNIPPMQQSGPVPQNVPPMQQGGPIPQNVPPMQQSGPIPQNVPPMQQSGPMPQNVPPMQQPGNAYRVKTNAPVKKEKKDMERTVGRQIMGIAASILIFIGITLFAMLIIPNLTDSIKMAAMFLFSFALTAVGITLMLKKAGGDFGVILAACGMGSVYISLYVTAVYFKSLDDIPLYILLLLWIIFICVLSRKGAYLFHLIGVIGIVVSVFFSFHILESGEPAKTIFLTAYFIVGSVAFLISSKREYKEYLTDAIGIVFSSVSLSVFLVLKMGSDEKPAGVLLLIFIIAFILYSMLLKYDEYPMTASILSMFASFVYLPLCCYVIDENGTMPLASIAMVVAVTAFYRFKGEESDGNFAVKAAWLSVFMLFGSFSWLNWDLVSEYIGLAPILLAVVFYGFFAEDAYYVFCGMALYFIHCFSYGMDSGEARAFCLLAFTFAFAFVPHLLMHFKDCRYKKAVKLGYYLLALLSVFGCINYYFITFSEQSEAIYMILSPDDSSTFMHDEAVSWLCCFVIIAVANAVLSRTAFIYDEDGDEIDMVMAVPMYIINVLLMIAGMASMNAMKDAFGFKWLYILITLALLFVNLDRIKAIENIAADIYLGFRFNLFMLAVLAALDAQNYTFSTCCFALALVGIIIGFFIKKKAMRIYFLVVTLVSVVKLVMYDISYDNSAMRAMSFIISGVLCLVISFVYQKADKKLGEANQPILQPIQQPMQQPVQQPMQQPVQQPMQQPVQQPMQQPMQPPIQQPEMPDEK